MPTAQSELRREIAYLGDEHEPIAQLPGRGGIAEQAVDRLAREQQTRLARRDVGEVAAGRMPRQSDAHSAHREIAVRGRSREAAERVVAEAYAAGAQGCEEREEAGLLTFLLYAPAASADAVWRAADAAAGAEVEVAAPRALPPVDWSEAWKAELAPIVVSARLAVRPSFAAFDAAPGQRVLVVDPGQAFGTGAHESTRLALELVALRAPDLGPRARILDVGTGSGVLALAALALAPSDARALAFDLDPLAAPEARHNAARNGLAARLALWTGGAQSLAPGARLRADRRQSAPPRARAAAARAGRASAAGRRARALGPARGGGRRRRGAGPRAGPRARARARARRRERRALDRAAHAAATRARQSIEHAAAA